MTPGSPAVKFAWAWLALLAAKAWLAATLPLFGDESFYWLEGQHPAWAYSDLPALTAWLARLGVAVGGQHPLALRAPFLLLGAAVPWLVVRIARREGGEAAGWQAGMFALLMPLSGWLGTLALPDAPLVLACLLALDACARLLRAVERGALLELAVALVIGGLTHYRFAPALLAGAVGLAMVPRGRALLARPAVWAVLAIGALAWLPLLLWNQGHGEAGLRFQVVDRHPWVLHGGGGTWLVEQAVALTPGLFVLALATGVALWRRWRRGEDIEAAGLFLGVALVSVAGYFVLAFFADQERVSFHWPLAGWLALLCVAPAVFARWSPGVRRTVLAVAGLGLVATVGVLAGYASPAFRASLADSRWYPDNFAGWREVATVVDADLVGLPAGTRLVADNFMLGAQLGFARGDAGVPVLEHPLNAKHGRAAQLQAWGLEHQGRADLGTGPLLLVVEDTARPLKARLDAYHDLCRRFGPLPPPRVLDVDHGRKRFLRFVLPGPMPTGACVAPAIAYIDLPGLGATVVDGFAVEGWAFKDGPGLAAVEVTVDGRVVAQAQYGHPMPNVAAYWAGSTDPHQPAVGFRAQVPAGAVAPGEHWLGLRLHGTDGSVEAWPEQRLRVAPGGQGGSRG
jgi:hypothetical protein